MRTYTAVDGCPRHQDEDHDLWLLTEQDCDLDQTLDSDTDRLFELRAVREHAGDIPSNIVGAEVRIDDTHCLKAMDHAVKVTATWLMANVENRVDTAEKRRREIKTWLGYRYDRPAVPKEFVEIHKRIQSLAKAKRGKPDPNKPAQLEENWTKINLKKVRDVFVAYERAQQNGKIRASLIAIANSQDSVPEVQEWMERIRDGVLGDEVFVISDVTAEDVDGTSLSVPEKAFSIYADTHSLQTAT